MCDAHVWVHLTGSCAHVLYLNVEVLFVRLRLDPSGFGPDNNYSSTSCGQKHLWQKKSCDDDRSCVISIRLVPATNLSLALGTCSTTTSMTLTCSYHTALVNTFYSLLPLKGSAVLLAASRIQTLQYISGICVTNNSFI